MAARALSIRESNYTDARSGSVLRLFTAEFQDKIKGTGAGGAAPVQTLLAEKEQAMPLPNSIGRGLSSQERNAFGHWLAGFTDGEGCFFLGTRPRRYKNKVYNIHFGIFTIGVRRDDAAILYKIRDFLGCGAVTIAGRMSTYRVSRTQHLNDILVPFFQQYGLHSKKKRDFSIWQKAINLLERVRRRPRPPGQRKEGDARWSDRESLQFTKLATTLRDTRQYKISREVVNGKITTEEFGNWLAGLSDGEGCFTLRHSDPRGTSKDKRRSASFQIALRLDDKPVLEWIRRVLNCGQIHVIQTPSTTKRSCPLVVLQVNNTDSIMSTLLPLLTNNPLRAKKSRDFAIWTEGVKLLNRIKHKSFCGRYADGKFKWSIEESSLFANLCARIKKIREYSQEGAQ